MEYFQILNSYGGAISLFGLIIAIVIFLRQRKIYGRQETILKDVEKTVNEVDDITKRLKTDELIDSNVKQFFRISDEYASGYKCIYPHIDNKDQRIIPDIRLGDSFAVLSIKALLGIKNHPLRLIGVDRGAGEPGSCDIQGLERDYKNCIIVCTHMLDNEYECPFPEPEEIVGKSLEEQSVLIPNFPCWFVRGERNIIIKKDGKAIPNPIRTTAIIVNGYEPIFSSIDYLYTTNQHDASTNYSDYGILSRIKYKDRFYILCAGIHNIGTWFVVEYLRKVIYGEVNAPQGLLGEDDFIAVIEGDYSPNKRWIENVNLKHNFYWHKPSGNDESNWTRGEQH